MSGVSIKLNDEKVVSLLQKMISLKDLLDSAKSSLDSAIVEEDKWKGSAATEYESLRTTLVDSVDSLSTNLLSESTDSAYSRIMASYNVYGINFDATEMSLDKVAKQITTETGSIVNEWTT